VFFDITVNPEAGEERSSSTEPPGVLRLNPQEFFDITPKSSSTKPQVFDRTPKCSPIEILRNPLIGQRETSSV